MNREVDVLIVLCSRAKSFAFSEPDIEASVHVRELSIGSLARAL